MIYLRVLPLLISLTLASFAFAVGLEKNQAIDLTKDHRIQRLGAIPNASPDGQVPAWNGGLPHKPRTGLHHERLYADESPLFTVTAENHTQYQDYLSPGLIALLTTYPDSFELPIYSSHRTASYPDWIYQNTVNASTKPTLGPSGARLDNAISGVNFPHPSNGLEAIWNHLTRWRGMHLTRNQAEVTVYKTGKHKRLKMKLDVAFELYRKNTAQLDRQQVLLYYSSYVTAPPNLAGGALLAIDYLNQQSYPRQAWSYDAGQRRVKRLPYISYDNPALLSESLRTADDTDMFSGSPDRYNWRLITKRIMYIPYNNYELSSPDVNYEDLLTPKHINPAYTRYEAHRVWVVEATLKPDNYHIYPKRVFYIDEDSWSIVLADQYDQQKRIWRVSMAYLKNFYEVPLTFSAADVFHDLKTQTYLAGGLTNEE